MKVETFDDLKFYRFYMRNESLSLPPELPPGAMLELPPLEAPVAVKTSFPYQDFCALVDRVALSGSAATEIVLDPWILWESLDPKQRRSEGTESALNKAMRRVHSGIKYTIGAAPVGKMTAVPSNLPLRLYRGAVCCLASESKHWKSCLRYDGEYGKGIPTIIASGGMALVKGDITEPEKLFKRMWIYLNHDATGFAVGRASYGDWSATEITDACLRVEKALGIKAMGTFYPDTASRLGLSKRIEHDPSKTPDQAPFRTAWFTVRPEWRAPYTDGMEGRPDPKNPIRQCLTPQNWYPMSVAESPAKAKVAPGVRVLKARIRMCKNGDAVLKIIEQSHKATDFNKGAENPREFMFRGAMVVSDRYLELRLHSDPPVLIARGEQENLDDKEMPYYTCADSDAEKKEVRTAIARLAAAVRAYNTDPESDPFELVEEE